MQMIKVIPLALLLGAPSVVVANDFPTRDRVAYVLNCLQEIGRNSMEDLQTCSCRIDSVASAMSFESYGWAVTYDRNKRMTGEKGSVFRDNIAGKSLSKQLVVANEIAKDRCIQVVQIVAPTDLTGDKRYNRYDEEQKLQ